ncbi:MAG: divalent-cation tolerance protein CutA [Planctomycetes bacterium]|nr:divalent-cation tolerance protein CutA [Planctomycetota bacterium]
MSLVTVGKASDAKRIARALVEERLAACVNLVPGVRSVYRWRGKRCEDREILLIVKSRADRLKMLARRVKELHSYEVPEIIHLSIASGHAPYLRWIDECVG